MMMENMVAIMRDEIRRKIWQKGDTAEATTTPK